MTGRRRTPKYGILAALAILGLSWSARAESTRDLLGVIDFPNSGAPEAQADFIEGVLYLHNFEYDESARAFKRAQALDPDFAMAYWGEAMTYNHALWGRQKRQSALSALRRLGRTPEDRQAKAPTRREKDYLGAVELLYGTVGAARQVPPNARADLYSDAMRRLHESHETDREAATFYGLSILATAHRGRDFAIYMRAAAVLTGVWDANRKHPGAAHYLIHSYDDPIHAPLGLPMARAYSEIAPGAAHAQHMVSHIFVALGMWDDVVKSNRIAIETEDANPGRPGGRPRALGHYTFWLLYGYLERGEWKNATRMMENGYARVNDDPVGQEQSYFGNMLSRHVVDTGDWDAAERWAFDFPPAARGADDYYFARAYAAAGKGDLDAARKHLATLGETAKRPGASRLGIREILVKEIEGVLAHKEGNDDAAVGLLEEAVAMELELPLDFGPPPVAKPASELLGEVLTELDRNEEAARAFELQLTRTPRRTASLLGLARAAKALGHGGKARDAYQRLAAIWHSADRGIAGYEEAVRGSAER